jgi:hypothetical protein
MDYIVQEIDGVLIQSIRLADIFQSAVDITGDILFRPDFTLIHRKSTQAIQWMNEWVRGLSSKWERG